MPETIPGLLAAAADRDPDGIWLRTDEQQLSFAEAAGRIAAVAERLASFFAEHAVPGHEARGGAVVGSAAVSGDAGSSGARAGT